MTTPTTLFAPRWRRAARVLALLGVAVSGVGMFSEVSSALPAGTPAAGGMVMVPATGDSGTTFLLDFTTPPQFCPGDNTASYVWHTFITPATNDPADMVYSASGTPTGEPAFTNNLADTIGVRVRNQLPGLGDGTVIRPTDLSFANAFYAGVTPGEYWLGVACTQPDVNFAAQTMRFWAGRIIITASAGAGPNNFTYAAAGVQPTTTTTTTTVAPTSTTTTVPTGSTTSTTVAGATTTTTVVGGTTTTTNPCPSGTTTSTSSTSSTSSTTTTTGPCATTTTTAPASGITTTTVRFGSSGVVGSGSVGSGSGSSLASTGPSSSTPTILMWGILLVLFGRIAVLLARPITVTTGRS